ncbi:DeoR family transcriptional regulator [Stackebrandtia endophytica]|uniref:DeoR family transcriptional regulator n=1 Tax=Stackebrandtia endophytica TaxID=1496996 RepID=A0A543AYE9_9ACTN|nr:DeoR/GlpR family DNA-binding transcription regulator [Stackebrandtia endophytica]TQL77606.1 DeoR family transcriptional regulator [Stackebrandtia endophytica]
MSTDSQPTAEDGGRRHTRAARHEAIIEHLSANDRIDVTQLAERFDVTEMTIRRDLAALDSQGRVTRVHGGALPPKPIGYETRATINSEAKAAIAVGVSRLITDGETVGLDMGTTCHAIAAELAKRDGLTIVTYSMHVAMAFRHSGSRAIVLGGEMTDELTLVNGGLVQLADNLVLDSLVVSCAGVSPRFGVSYFDAAEVEVRRVMAARADRLILAADAGKWGRHSTFSLGPLSMFSAAVTDAVVPEELREAGGPDLDLVVVG